MIDLALALIAAGLLVCLFDLRWGAYLTVAAGLLQDPLRKLVPGEPVHVTALVALFAAVLLLGGLLRGEVRGFGALPEWRKRVWLPMQAFITVVLIQSTVTLVSSGSVFLAGIGFLAYLSPLGGLLLGYAFATRPRGVVGLLWAYVVLAALMTFGVYLSEAGFEWDSLRSVGEDLIVYSIETGEAIPLPAGFFRAPEMAAWHSATGAVLALLLGMASRRGGVMALGSGLSVFFIVAVFLTGRRKFLIEIVIFLPVFWLLLRHFGVGSAKFLRGMTLAVVLTALLGVGGLVTDDTSDSLRESRQRSDEPIVTQIVERTIDMSIGSIPYVIDQNGFFGAGAGMGSQGAQHFGGGDVIVGAAAEGGIGKVLAEIGVPGVLAFGWLVMALVAYTWRTLGIASRADIGSAILAIGLAAFLFSNVLVFVVAHQPYGDVNVILLLGLCLGFVVAARHFGGARYPVVDRAETEGASAASKRPIL